MRPVEPRLLGVGATPNVAIGQRALIVQTDAGNVMWDAPGFIDEDAIAAVRDIGGLTAIAASHPHFYGTIVEWAHVFGAAILIPHADQQWLMRPDPAVTLWEDRWRSPPALPSSSAVATSTAVPSCTGPPEPKGGACSWPATR